MSKGKAFETFRIGGIRFLAFPQDGGVYIVDENGNGYGAYFTVENFRKATAAEPVAKIELTKRLLA